MKWGNMNKKALEEFNYVYDKTYKEIVKYVLLHCNNINDVNDIVQEIYFNLYKYLSRKRLKTIDYINTYVLTIAKNTLKKYYRFKTNNVKNISIDQEGIDISSDLDLELQFITKDNFKSVWEYLKRKDIRISKIFYAYYYLGMKISEIAIEMQLNESSVKNYIYRTTKELQNIFEKGEN